MTTSQRRVSPPDPRGGQGRVAVVTPLAEELARFQRTVPGVREIPYSGAGRFYAGKLTFLDVILGWTGDGPRAAREGLEVLLSEHAVSHLLFLGVAGGLTDGIDFGQLLVAREVRDEEGVAPAPEPEWIDRAMDLPGMREAVFYSCGRIVTRAADKYDLGSRLLDESASRTGAAAVDLETATYARTAAEHGIPYTVIRALSDSVDEDLPLDFNRFLDSGGRTRRGRIVLYALTHPWVIGSLLILGGRVRYCARRLSDAAIFTLLSGGPGGGSRRGFRPRMMLPTG